MKKLFILPLASLVLAACTSGVDEDDLKPVAASHNIKHICLKGNLRKAPDNFVEFLQASLQKKNITSEYVKDKQDMHCKQIMYFNVKGNTKIVAKARLEVKDMTNNKLSIGSLYYRRGGDEKDRVKEVGLQGQTDLMVNQLFQ